ncbi:Serine hydroxymethyltransferase, cytosolic [Neolecta irregularis DAH-3]|uniref:Serine hydroxymethyltransferase n=1 Tax=Neolecta irregularis (strain DAH-3) TaxID=1198029 RepID=A0A1U7LWG8_NEOID|nr:Serine hydroxymethyltransferase, cytosolic [Neolecta irregularis DAH-3]|eukprot:OLL26913.1 Serine hydroxymethyltransferase, cytosolic [Neolecta irregularis DAH-3]
MLPLSKFIRVIPRLADNRSLLARNASAFATSQYTLLGASLTESDQEIGSIIENEKKRQRESIVLIPSENFTSRAVFDALGSPMQNKYAEGYPGARYYGGNEFIDAAEILCQKRALEAFGLDPQKWGVNVQALSGAPANLYVYQAVMKPHDRLMGLDLPHGGHLSHGYQTENKKISAVSTYFETMPYRCDTETGLIDYDMLEKTSLLFRPKVIIAGASAYSRLIDYPRMKKIAEACGAYLVSDMAHISGMVAAKTIPSPFEYSDIVTTTTHKSLRGPRGALIFFRKGLRKTDNKGNEIMYDLENSINFSVFPSHQGGPHENTAIAVALGQTMKPEFKEYQEKVVKNAKVLAHSMNELGYRLVSGGTDTHLILIDLRDSGIDGARVERILELANIAANKNTVPGDKSALIPGGLRLGTPAMTTRGFEGNDFEKVAEFIHRAIEITKSVQRKSDAKKLKDFKEYLGNGKQVAELQKLKQEVISYVKDMPIPT